MIWNPLFWTTHQLLWIVPVLAFVILVCARNGNSARDFSDGRIEFAPSRLESAAWILLVLYEAYAAIDLLEHGSGKYFEFVNAAAVGGFVLALLFWMPGAVVISRDGLQQVYWFRKNKRIRWEEIVEINTGKKKRTVTITGADGTKIVHSRQLADRPRLLKELKQHCGENLPPDFPREPI